MMLSWKERYDRMKNHYGWTDADIADIVGNTPKSVSAVVNSKTEELPRWLRLAIYLFELENGDESKTGVYNQASYNELFSDLSGKGCVFFESKDIPRWKIGLAVDRTVFIRNKLLTVLESYGIPKHTISQPFTKDRPQNAPEKGYIVSIPLPIQHPL